MQSNQTAAVSGDLTTRNSSRLKPIEHLSATPEIAARLRLVVEGTVSETGEEFFRALVRNLARALDTIGAWVTEFLPKEQKLRALAMWFDGEFVDGYEYQVDGTPCQTAVE